MGDLGVRPPQMHASLKDTAPHWDPQIGAVVDPYGVIVPAPSDSLPLALPAPPLGSTPVAGDLSDPWACPLA
eukprot:14436025-Alexandrium_andersonii.AAC.1